MNALLYTLAVIGGLVTVVSVVVSILLYGRSAYSKQKIEELRDDRDDAISRADAYHSEAMAKDQALARCQREAEHLRRENEILRDAPKVKLQAISDLLDKSTQAILDAVAGANGSKDV